MNVRFIRWKASEFRVTSCGFAPRLVAQVCLDLYKAYHQGLHIIQLDEVSPAVFAGLSVGGDALQMPKTIEMWYVVFLNFVNGPLLS
jgi:hypothetical protein